MQTVAEITTTTAPTTPGPSVLAYARAIRLTDGWQAFDVDGLAREVGRRGKVTFLVSPKGVSYRVPFGTRAADLVARTFKPIASRPVAKFGHGFTEAVWKVGQRSGRDCGAAAVALLEELSDRAAQDGLIDADKFDC